MSEKPIDTPSQIPTMIEIPGMYDLPSHVYHRIRTPTPSLSSTGAKTLIDECPAVYDYEKRNTTHKEAYDIGSASHLMMLEPEKFDQSVVIIQADSYRTNAAKQARDEAREAGLIPLLPDDAQMIKDMRTALHSDPVARSAFRDGLAEQSFFWQDPEFGIWCRSRPDWTPYHGRYMLNYKTSTSAHPQHVAKQIWDLGYYQSSAWELDAYEHVNGTRPAKFGLVVQAKKPPYLVTVHWLDATDLMDGEKENRRARGIFARCLETGNWHGFWPNDDGPGAFNTSVPGWARRELNGKEESGAFMAPQDMTVGEK